MYSVVAIRLDISLLNLLDFLIWNLAFTSVFCFFLPETISSSNSLSLPASKLRFGGQGGLGSDASTLTFDAFIFANCLSMR